ncbi:DUF58 domain-containing protein [Dechloromonas sp. A34]|uniref:DUF58 domain-containing protein n=1 Tax=Dechloromonas sp. A34 TaxID=447588 RepID=UPI00224948BF|nr:DUF58 domain-containing protein [Dechloromonas sp. A34]
MSAAPLTGWLAARRKALVLIALTVIAYLAAINRGQAFPWAMAGLLTATLITGYTWPHWLVKRLSATRTGPTRAEEGETIAFQVVVANRGWLPRFMVEFIDHLPFAGPAETGTKSSEKVLGLLAYLPGLRSSHFEVSVLCEKRGHYQLGPVALASSFPLGLAEARQSRRDGVQTLTVYPDVFNIMALPLRGAPSQIHRGGYVLPEGAGAAEFAGLRDYRRGDNPRHIHWPSTARLNELIVREYEPLASACLYLVLDQRQAANIGHGKESTFEYAVRIAASMARYACLQNIRTRVAGEGQHLVRLPAGAGDAHYQDILDHLAVVDCDGRTAYADLLTEIGADCIRGETAVVFLAENPAYAERTLQALAILQARRVHIFAVVFDQDSFRAGDNGPPIAAADGLTGALLELGAHIVRVRRGDDLVQLFNS